MESLVPADLYVRSMDISFSMRCMTWLSVSAAAERAALIKKGFFAFISIGSAFGPLLEEVRAIAILLYSGNSLAVVDHN